jgi:hypothetical protein
VAEFEAEHRPLPVDARRRARETSWSAAGPGDVVVGGLLAGPSRPDELADALTAGLV